MRMPALRRLAAPLMHTAPVQNLATRLPLLRRAYNPFDREFGTNTGGFLSVEELQPDAEAGRSMHPYLGSQPSIVRRALAQLPVHAGYSFFDVGCGKGRPLMVASEFPFNEVIGVELSERLVEVARRNAAKLHARYPQRPAIRVLCADAAHFRVDQKHAVIFLYHSLPRHVLQQFLANLERQIESTLEHAFLLYYNPVEAAVLDASEHLVRWSAQTVPYAAEEIGFGPDCFDSIIVWQTVPPRYPAQTGAERKVLLDDSWHAELAPLD